MTARDGGSEDRRISRFGATGLFSVGLLAGVALAALATAFSAGLGGGQAPGPMLAAAEARAAALQQALEQALAERDVAHRRQDALAARFAAAEQMARETELALSERSAALDQAFEAQERAADAQRALAAKAEAAGRREAAARIALAGAEARAEGLTRALEKLGTTMDEVIAERDFALARNGRLDGELDGLREDLALAVDREDRLVARLALAADESLDGLERVFKRADLDLDALLEQTERDFSGRGGPFREADEEVASALTPPKAPDARDVAVAALTDRFERLGLMQFAATKVPFALPVIGGRLTSGFGHRRDPFRGQISMHQGIDIAAPRGTPIKATADGVVTFVGRQRGYGIVVEIRHAFGFETLYAHLSKARVTLGQQVGRGDRIGDMGSTGRSTGNHLHYEVRINSKAVNPLKFIEAARDVL
ncbi:MAG: M23 family metallopeptidase [Pseudomonadota bacterium]